MSFAESAADISVPSERIRGEGEIRRWREPDTGVRVSLVSRLQNHDEAGTGYAGRDLLLVDSEEMF